MKKLESDLPDRIFESYEKAEVFVFATRKTQKVRYRQHKRIFTSTFHFYNDEKIGDLIIPVTRSERE